MAQAIKNKLMGGGKKQRTLEDVGVRNLRNEDVQIRLGKYKDAKDTIQKYSLLGYNQDNKEFEKLEPEKFISQLQQGIFEINSLISEIGAPWGGAGTEQWFAEARSAWKTIYVQMSSMASSVKILMDIKESEKSKFSETSDEKLKKRNEEDLNTAMRELVNNFFTFYQVEYLAYSQLMLDLCWRRDDVATNWALTIYQQPMPTQSKIDLSGTTVGGGGDAGGEGYPTKHERV